MSGEISRRLAQLQTELSAESLAREGFDVFKPATPIAKGNARRKTQLRGSDIVADYPYAGRLDQGHSKQAPDGMIKPTVEHVQQYIKDSGNRGV